MTWAEFQIRAHAYQRTSAREEALFREVGWMALNSFHVSPKDLKRKKHKIWPIPRIDLKEIKRTTEKQKAAMVEAWKKYHEAVAKKNGTD